MWSKYGGNDYALIFILFVDLMCINSYDFKVIIIDDE